MTVTFTASRSIPKSLPVRAVLVTSESRADGLDGFSVKTLAPAGWSGGSGETYLSATETGCTLLVGLGPSERVDAAAVRTAGAKISKQLGRFRRVGVDLSAVPVDGETARQALAEGITLAGYRYRQFKSDVSSDKTRSTTLNAVTVGGGSGAKHQAALDRGAVLARGQSLARDLVNEPGGSLTPPVFARRAAAMARSQGLVAKVWDEAAIKRGKLGGLLGVNRGSSLPPRFVELTYNPKGRAQGTLALVGKGITFDSGGLSIKTGQGMMTMKCDMGGAAAVVGAMSVLGELGVGCRVKAFLPMTDNMLGGDATRPGDVLTIRNGKTIEVLNTDAEGRLILADALSLASEAKPDAIIDLATLTGACMVALGPKIAGLMGNNDSWIEQIESASTVSGERVWHLPLPDDYRKQFESPVADMKNIGTPHGGALTAGLILQEFVADGIPWAHLDIAGPAWSDSEEAEITKGGTGFGVRLLAELAQAFTPPS